MENLIQYLKETRAELDHVTWPKRSTTIIYTALVVAFSLITGVYLSLLDFGFTSVLDTYLLQ